MNTPSAVWGSAAVCFLENHIAANKTGRSNNAKVEQMKATKNHTSVKRKFMKTTMMKTF